jgi:hypothetical protein
MSAGRRNASLRRMTFCRYLRINGKEIGTADRSREMLGQNDD